MTKIAMFNGYVMLILRTVRMGHSLTKREGAIRSRKGRSTLMS